MPDTQDANHRAARPGNLVHLVRRRRFWLPMLGAAVAGLALSAAFPPLAWWPLAWVALAPLLAVGLARPRQAFALGYAFGLAHFTSTFAWLRPVFLLAPLGLALVCALYPAVWLCLAVRLVATLEHTTDDELRSRTDPRHPFPLPRHAWWHGPLLVLLLAALWTGLEWVRSWAFTGFPWNLLGVSQWAVRPLLPVTRFTGVFGLSFLIVAVNAAVALTWRRDRRPAPWPVVAAAVLTVLLFLPVAATRRRDALAPPARHLRVGACQGKIPQIREYRPEQLVMALETYLGLTAELVHRDRPDLVVWPETAVPAPMTEIVADDTIREHLRKFAVPLLIGSVEWRPDPADGEDLCFNSALLFDRDLNVTGTYDKIKIVPFGEYVPFGRYLPWLVDAIGMGRGLTRGNHLSLFRLPDGAEAGVNICYEDIFPEISRGFVRRGARVLFTITNDAWYRRTSGSAQHTAHAVFRAVETARPLLRSGNNADTCLILPDGTIVGRLVDPRTGDHFYRGSAVYDVPIRDHQPLTFYVRHGDVFARLCALLGAGVAAWIAYRWLCRKQRLAKLIAPDELPPGA